MDRSAVTVGVAFLVMFANNGFIIAGLTAFDGSLLTEMGLSYGSLKLRDTITILSLGVSVPFIGVMLDRVRVRPIIVAGLLLMAAGFLAYRFVQSPWQMYAAQVMLGASQACCGLVAHVVLISRWTSRRRGLALGLVVAGSSLGNAMIPALNGFLIAHFPWRQAILFGGGIALLLIPVVYAVYRERPDVSASEAHGIARTSESAHEIPMPDAGRNFWLLGMVAGTSVLCVLGLVTNLYLYVTGDLHFPGHTAEKLLFALFAGSCGAQIAAGMAADRLGAGSVHRAALSLMLVGMLGVVLMPATLLLPTIAIYGVGWGANSAMLQLQPVALFPTATLGRTLGMLAVMETVGGAMAPALVGYARDVSGSYRLPFAVLAAIMVASVTCVCLMRSARPIQTRSEIRAALRLSSGAPDSHV